MGRVPEQALRWGLERVTAERDLCEVLHAAGWLDSDLLDQVRRETLREEPERSPTLPDRRHETEALGLSELPPAPPTPPQPQGVDESGWPVDEPAPSGGEEAAGEEVGIEAGRLGPYRVLRKLGQGGMGMVFLAEHTLLRREVALKLIRPREGADSGRALRRFEIEARAMARLEHPNILKILDVRVEAKQAYMVMDLARGGTLGDRIGSTQGPLGIEEVVTWIEGLARALHHAHEHAIVHRDVKPDNILFDEENRPLLTDFGLAKALDEDNAGISTPGAMIGTLLYMSPEQIEGNQVVDARADVYALGATFYEALTGLPPFMAASAHELINKVLSRHAPSPAKSRAEVPADVETIVARCLAKERDERYQTALALAEDCQRFRERRPILARPVGVPERLRLWVRRNPLLALGGLLAAACLLISPAIYDAIQQRDRARRAIETADAVRSANLKLETEEAKARGAEAQALKAKRVAQASLAQATYLQATLEAQAGYRRRAAGLFTESARQLSALGEDSFAATAGRWDLWRRSPQGLLPFPGTPEARRLALRGDRVWIGRGGKLEIWDANRAVLLERLRVPAKEPLVVLVLSQDGRQGLGGGGRGSIWLWKLGTPEPRALTRCKATVMALAFRNQGDFALSVDDDNLVRLHQIQSGTELLIPIQATVRALCFVPGTKRFLVGLDDEVQIWDAEQTRHVGTVKVPGLWLAGYGKLALAGGPGAVHLIDPLANAIRHRFDLDPRPIRALAFGSKGGFVLDVAGVAHHLNTRDLRRGRRWELVSNHVRGAAFDADGGRVVTVEPLEATPGKLRQFPIPRLWRLEDSRHERDWRGPRRARTALTQTPQGLLVSGCASGALEIWDPDLELRVGQWLQPVSVTALASHADQVASGGSDGKVRLWRIGEAKPLAILGPHLGPIRALAFSPGGQQLLVGGEGTPTLALDLPPDDPARNVLKGYPVGPQSRVTLRPDGGLEVEGPTPAKLPTYPLRLWDLQSREPLQTWSTGRVTSLDWSGVQPLSGGQAGRLLGWDPATGAQAGRTTLPPPDEGVSQPIQALLRREAGWVLAAGGILWRVPERGAPAERLRASKQRLARALSLAPGPTSTSVWSGHVDGRVALWNLTTRRAVLVVGGHQGEVTALATLPDGRLLSVGQDGRVLVRDFGQDAARAAVELDLRREAERRSRGGSAAPWPSELVGRLAATSGAWDLAAREIHRDGSLADRRAAARDRRDWPALEELLPKASPTRAQLQAGALKAAIRIDHTVAEADELLRVGRVEPRDLNRLVNTLSDLARSSPGDAGVHLQLGRMAEATQREEIAAQSYLTALRIDPDLSPRTVTPGFLIARGRWHLAAQRDAAALIDFRRLGESKHRIAGRPSRIYAHLLLAAGDRERALAALGADQEPQDRRLRSEILRRSGDHQAALKALDAEDETLPTALARARVLRELGRLGEAQRILNAILKLKATSETRLRVPHAFRYFEGQLERYVREPSFVVVHTRIGPERLGERDLLVRYRIVASETLQIVGSDYVSRVKRRPVLMILQARVELARVLCRASRSQAKNREELLDAAVEQLRLVVAEGLLDFEAFHTDPDLTLLRQLRTYQAILREEKR